MQEFKDDLKIIKSHLVELRVDVAKNTVSLDHHIARTDAAERRLEKLEYILIGSIVVGIAGGLIKLFIS